MLSVLFIPDSVSVTVTIAIVTVTDIALNFFPFQVLLAFNQFLFAVSLMTRMAV